MTDPPRGLLLYHSREHMPPKGHLDLRFRGNLIRKVYPYRRHGKPPSANPPIGRASCLCQVPKSLATQSIERSSSWTNTFWRYEHPQPKSRVLNLTAPARMAVRLLRLW